MNDIPPTRARESMGVLSSQEFLQASPSWSPLQQETQLTLVRGNVFFSQNKGHEILWLLDNVICQNWEFMLDDINTQSAFVVYHLSNYH